MLVIEWRLCLYLFFIFLSSQSNCVCSIQCCTGDSLCHSPPVDCPSNVCFKLVLSKTTEERGCMNDLLDILKFPNLSNSAGDDQCQELDPQVSGMSLCKCTGDLCNSAAKPVALLGPLAVASGLLVYQFTSISLL